MKERILLVKPGYENPYPPLGLMKISTWYKSKGDIVHFKDDARDPNTIYFSNDNEVKVGKLCEHYDKLYITSLFTYHARKVIESIYFCQEKYPHSEIKVGGIMATLLSNYIKEKTGIESHKGLLDGAENCSPDYKLFSSLFNLKCSITFTTRGCPRRCEFCAVKEHEPEFFPKENWEKDIDPNKNLIIFWDNNWFYSPNFFKDIQKLKKLNKPFDFNQGLDCRLFDEEKAKLLSQTRLKLLRFAFDNSVQDGYIQNAIKLAQKHGFKDMRVYVLYNSHDPHDTPEYFFYRINELNKLGALSYPMKFRPIDSIDGNYISPYWDKQLLRALKLSLMFYYTRGMINKKRWPFEEIFGKTASQFKNKLYGIYKRDRNKGSHKKTLTRVTSLFGKIS